MTIICRECKSVMHCGKVSNDRDYYSTCCSCIGINSKKCSECHNGEDCMTEEIDAIKKEVEKEEPKKKTPKEPIVGCSRPPMTE